MNSVRQWKVWLYLKSAWHWRIWAALKNLADPLSKYFQIAAIIAGGVWTYNVFIATQQPGLLKALSVTTDLAVWREPSNGICQALHTVSIENFSSSVVKIDHLRFMVWASNLPEVLEGSKTGLQVMDISKLLPIKPPYEVMVKGSMHGAFVPKAKIIEAYPMVLNGIASVPELTFGVVPEDENNIQLTPVVWKRVPAPCNSSSPAAAQPAVPTRENKAKP